MLYHISVRKREAQGLPWPSLEYNPETFDWQRYCRTVVERVVSLGRLSDFMRPLIFMTATAVSGELSVTRQSTSLPGISISHVMPSTLTQQKRSATSASKLERGSSSGKVMNNRDNPSVGIFWYDSASHSLFGVRKQEVTPSQIETAACDGLPFIIYPETNEEVWQQEKFPGDYALTSRGRVSWVVNRFVVLVGS